MRLTPADVHNVAFSKPPIGKRGYNEDEVDQFLDFVEAELARLIEENTDLKQRVEELESELADARSGGGAQADDRTQMFAKPAAAPEPPPPMLATAGAIRRISAGNTNAHNIISTMPSTTCWALSLEAPARKATK